MKKIVIISLSLFFILFCSTIIYFQIKVETYKNELNDVYDFNYLKSKRSRYTPFVVFFLESKILKKNKIYWLSMNKPYEEYEKTNNIKRKHGETYYWLFNIEYNAYLMYCYDVK